MDNNENKYVFKGFLGKRLKANEEEWLLKAPGANPAMAEIFYMRNSEAVPNLDVWSGEYPGKFITGAVLCWKMSRSEKLRSVIADLVWKLCKSQAEDGYLGPFPKDKRFFGKIKKCLKNDWIELVSSGELGEISSTARLLKNLAESPIYDMHVCDLWGHYHCMLGLWLWHEETGDYLALKTCTGAADLICRTFLDGEKKIADTGSRGFNMAIVHIFCLMYRRSGKDDYLRLINKIMDEWKDDPECDYMGLWSKKIEFYQTPNPRWETLHSIQALVELYHITGQEDYRNAFRHYYRSILLNDRHNTGGFSSGEKATGDPYHQSAIETCATVAWIALNVDMLGLSGESIVADELELATFNGMLGAQAPGGRWWTYNTPMDGHRKSFYHDINWQSLPGGPELSCCYTNAARGLGMLSQWSFITLKDTLRINYYGPGTFTLWSPAGRKIELIQETDYPVEGKIKIKIGIERGERFILGLRIPQWSRSASVSINGHAEKEAVSGSYFYIDRTWKDGDIVDLKFYIPLHFWKGRHQLAGKACIYYGPLLLAYDNYYNKGDYGDIQIPDQDGLKKKNIKKGDRENTWLLISLRDRNNRDIVLCDFASAGAHGNHYRTWLKILDCSSNSCFDPEVMRGKI